MDFLARGYALPLGSMLFAVGFGFLSRLGAEGIAAYRERKRLAASFGAYVSPGVMKEILAGRVRAEQGGARSHVRVLFSDSDSSRRLARL